MENNHPTHRIHTRRPLHQIDAERAKLAINCRRRVINVRKGEGNRQTNSSTALLELMIFCWAQKPECDRASVWRILACRKVNKWRNGKRKLNVKLKIKFYRTNLIQLVFDQNEKLSHFNLSCRSSLIWNDENPLFEFKTFVHKVVQYCADEKKFAKWQLYVLQSELKQHMPHKYILIIRFFFLNSEASLLWNIGEGDMKPSTPSNYKVNVALLILAWRRHSGGEKKVRKLE